ncbi:hypothetical protein ACHAXT_009920 [Thalassiosira profunda]
MVSSVALVCLAGLIALSAASVDHDGWDFYGGRRVRRKHGLNRATADRAPRHRGRVRFDAPTPRNEPQLIVTADEAPPAQSYSPVLRGSSDRARAAEQILLLPDRYSVLDFDRDQGDDYSSFWGRLYINGFPGSLQYFRTEFGGHPLLENADGIDEATVVVTMRGGCTFSEKAFAAHDAGAAGVLFVNTEEGLFHASGPDANELALSAGMITKHDGNHLVQALRRVSESSDSLIGRFVPIICNDRDPSYCSPVHQHDLAFERSLIYDGRLSINDGSSFEYVQGEFGAWVDPYAEWSVLVPTAVGGDAHCCDQAGFEGQEVANTTAVLCLRGECDFITKAENAAAVGARLVIVSSHNDTLTRMGCDPPLRGRKVDATAVMVTADAYEHMVDQFYVKLDAGSQSILRLSHHGQVCTEEQQ